MFNHICNEWFFIYILIQQVIYVIFDPQIKYTQSHVLAEDFEIVEIKIN